MTPGRLVLAGVAVLALLAAIYLLSRGYPTLWCSIIGSCSF